MQETLALAISILDLECGSKIDLFETYMIRGRHVLLSRLKTCVQGRFFGQLCASIRAERKCLANAGIGVPSNFNALQQGKVFGFALHMYA